MRRHYPYAHETNTIISIQSIQTRAYIGLTIVTKVLGLYDIHGGNTTTDMVVD